MKEIPKSLPVMELEECNLFPQGLLPLYIFEEKYRAMLQDALDSHRMFCVGTIDPSRSEQSDHPPVFEFSTAGLIRACVGNDDGTSHLVLQGISRIRLSDFDGSHPYWQATATPLASTIVDEERVAQLVERTRELITNLVAKGARLSDQMAVHLQQLEDPAALADFAAYNLIPTPLERQPLLGIEQVDQRLEMIADQLEILLAS